MRLSAAGFANPEEFDDVNAAFAELEAAYEAMFPVQLRGQCSLSEFGLLAQSDERLANLVVLARIDGLITVTNSYDANGNVTTRIHRTASGQLLRTETFMWDGYNRLRKESLRDAFTNGYDCVNVYDGLNRRLQSTFTTISSNVVQNTRTLQFQYDPEHEFMQVGVSIDGKQHWLVHGPDLNGIYGGLQGIGGLEAVIEQESQIATVLISDFFGNVVATNTYGVTASAQFLPTRYTAYGPLEGYQPPALSLNDSVATSFGWLGKTVEPTGKYDFGTRQYEPTERRFLSYDTIGLAGGNYGWGYCNGNPIYHYDPDGRLATTVLAASEGT